MSKRGLIFTSALLIFILLSFMGLYFGYFLISPAGIDKKEEIFIVKKGSGLKTVANKLEGRRLIKNKDLFMLWVILKGGCLLYTSPSPRDATLSRMPSSA